MSAAAPPRTATRLLRITWPFVAIVAVLLLFAGVSLSTMSAVRAYVGGESLWSKAQKTAVQYLGRYTRTRDEADFMAYGKAAAVIFGDRDARLALDQPVPDEARARAGLIAGRNDPADVDGMIALFRYFRRAPFMARAIDFWARGDALMSELDRVAADIHAAVQRNEPAQLAPLLARIRAIDAALTPIEEGFSATMAAASRRTAEILTAVNIAVGTALVVFAVVRTRRLLNVAEAAQHALEASEARFHRAVSGSSDGIWDWNVHGRELFLSPRVAELLGHGPAALHDTPRQFLRRIHPDDRGAVLASLRNHLRHEAPFDLDLRIRMHDGDYRWLRGRGRSVPERAGGVARFAGSLTDIADRKRAEAALFDERDRAQVTLASIADAVITVDLGGRVDYLNPVAERLTGWRAEAAQGRPVADVFVAVNEATGARLPDAVARALREGQTIEAESSLALMPREGAPIAIDRSIAPIRDRTGRIVGAVIVFHDMRRERQYAARLSHLASHDALTGLLNRREFEHRLRTALDGARDEDEHHAVLYLDLDQFKVVNDTCGHAAGDELLRQIGALLRPRLREGDTLSRLGGDEFGVLLPHCPPEPAARIAENLRRTIADFRFAWHRRTFAIGVSIGVVNIAQGPRTLSGVLSAADAACYMAKDKGRNRVQVYRPEDSEIALRHGEMEWVNRIHRALAEDRLMLYAQPIVPLQGGGPAHHELLLRLLDERNEVVPPMAFIPAAERYNLMPAIDRFVIRTAFAALARQPRGALRDGHYAINLSGASLGDEQFLDYVRAEFDRHRIPHASICFEITETTAVTSLSRAAEFMGALRASGCRFALDDFGVGVSSFTYLKHLPVDFLKIDGSFVKGMLQDPVDAAMVEAIHRIGRVMGKQTIAESVETPAIRDALARVGVDYGQGYGIAMPAPFTTAQEPAPLATEAEVPRRATG